MKRPSAAVPVREVGPEAGLRLEAQEEQRCRQERERQQVVHEERRHRGGREQGRRGDRREPHCASAGTEAHSFSQLWRSHHSTSPAASFTSAAPLSAALPFM